MRELAFARAGGGRSGGFGGGGGFRGGSYSSYGLHHGGRPLTTGETVVAVIALFALPIMLAIYAGIISYLYFTKGRRTLRKIKKRYQLDTFWHHDNIISYARDFYFEIQNHWTTNSLKAIRDKMTPRLFRQQQGLLNLYQRRKLVNRVEDIVFTKTEIVSFDDYQDNSKDRVAVMLEGTMKDYFTHLDEGEKRTDAAKFRDVFVFVRRGEELLLDEIVNEPDHHDIATMKNSIE